DSHAIPGLRSALKKNYDPFLKLTIARTLMDFNDKSGYDALVEILKDNEAGFARVQALELLKAKTGQDFGYNPEKTVGENSAALARLESYLKSIE
ncbi:MAG TPA: HEAT repeat domain-containing protein, partial [Terriglobia bacterium]|nr:HEAT repeat domain-containing protein [Terriglobia bacterium]